MKISGKGKACLLLILFDTRLFLKKVSTISFHSLDLGPEQIAVYNMEMSRVSRVADEFTFKLTH